MLMLAQGMGRWAVSQEPKLIPYLFNCSCLLWLSSVLHKIVSVMFCTLSGVATKTLKSRKITPDIRQLLVYAL